MTIDSPNDIEGLKRIGYVVARTIEEMKKHAKPGMTTRELDAIGDSVLSKYGATAAPRKLYRFPGATCISLNREVAHGIPGKRKLKGGDLINIDVSAELDGYYADTGHSFQIPPYEERIVKLCDYTHRTMMQVISQLRAGVKLNLVGKIIQAEARKGGYRVIQNLCSHGIGRALHEEPDQILPVFDPTDRRVLKEGQVLTIEPFLSTGANFAVEQADGWTLSVPDQSYAAQHEHTIIITKKEPIIVTTTAAGF
ncbi:type I methionyl aminopeptidase [Paenibacillus contaminans]|uniref:Methionine aminopeptidase n=1 Tax=Paenibacillus contaminans TaxID=450362 RepID=A0A329LZN4_9BACL|nr:type I methionyl aminopeptidase [Paenibacillus contaminans]RAV12938.1 type I methionyl aminopeptidase [Paenibacillus contaminans]